jgi:hypothetical protein
MTVPSYQRTQIAPYFGPYELSPIDRDVRCWSLRPSAVLRPFRAERAIFQGSTIIRQIIAEARSGPGVTLQRSAVNLGVLRVLRGSIFFFSRDIR